MGNVFIVEANGGIKNQLVIKGQVCSWHMFHSSRDLRAFQPPGVSTLPTATSSWYFCPRAG
jgi:hypothetical protein